MPQTEEKTYVDLTPFNPDDIIGIRSLATRVIAVAVRGGWGWRVYIDAVPGENHKREAGHVRDVGTHMRRHDAVHLFPSFNPERYED
jgi:hypothetical protein